MAGLPQLKAVSIRQAVGESLRQALLAGRFRPGEPLSELTLAAEMSVSRGPVREALLMLAQEGLVVHSQNHGFAVLNFTEDDSREIQQVRIPLETLALERARDYITAADLQQLAFTARQIVSAYEAGNYIGCTQADLEFHSLIWERTGNPRLASSLRHLMVPYFAYGAVFHVSRPDLSPALLKAQHESYLDFLRGQSRHSAEECVRLHTGL